MVSIENECNVTLSKYKNMKPLRESAVLKAMEGVAIELKSFVRNFRLQMRISPESIESDLGQVAEGLENLIKGAVTDNLLVRDHIRAEVVPN
jgi:hypothetical protein